MKQHAVLLALLLGLMFGLSACSGQTAIVFENNTACGTIYVELTNTETAITETYNITEGQSVTVEVLANVTYNYFVDYQGEGSICSGEYRGQVMIPGGSTQTFNLEAATPTPQP